MRLEWKTDGGMDGESGEYETAELSWRDIKNWWIRKRQMTSWLTNDKKSQEVGSRDEMTLIEKSDFLEEKWVVAEQEYNW